jgi:hypothetical protein
VKAIALVCAVAVAAMLGGCSSEADKTTPSRRGSDAARHYALLVDENWRLQEARDPRADDPLSALERPPLDWYDEYVPLLPNESALVRISGHAVTFDQTLVELERQLFQLHDVTVEGWRAVAGTRPGDTPPEALLVLDNGDSTLQVLSYELSLADLTALAGKIEPASTATWVHAGGVIR